MSWKFVSCSAWEKEGKGASVITTKIWTFQHNAQLLSLTFRIKVNRFHGAQNQNYVIEETYLWLKGKDFLSCIKMSKKETVPIRNRPSKECQNK